MRFRKHIKEEFGLRQFDVAPLIDVIFILLTFFMLTSNFMVHPGIRVDLPKTVTHEALRLERLSLVISSEDVLYLNGKVLTNSELEAILSDNKDTIQSVFIKADKDASMGRVVAIWDICREGGLNHINIATTNGKK